MATSDLFSSVKDPCRSHVLEPHCALSEIGKLLPTHLGVNQHCVRLGASLKAKLRQVHFYGDSLKGFDFLRCACAILSDGREWGVGSVVVGSAFLLCSSFGKLQAYCSQDEWL